MPARIAVSAVLAVSALAACGTVDTGQDFQFAEVVYDQNFFYCKVEPMLIAQKCGPGDPSKDGSTGCHETFTPFRLQPLPDAIPCTGIVPRQNSVSPEAQNNYQAAQREMSPNPEQAALLNRPTRKAAHPREIFKPDSDEAKIIRDWATRYSSK